ncbi:MAG: TIR domain-containing protein [Pseudonocardia sp.]
MAYDAFISYSHLADSRLAPTLQAGLRSFAKPWWRRRALTVFHDNAALAASPGLWSCITKAMDESRFFVLLASPAAAASPWVAKEIAYWRSTKPAGTLLPVLTDGEWVWDAQAGTFNWARSTAVPPALADVFTEEPRHIDVRWARTKDELDLRHSRFRAAVIEVAAPLHGIPKEDLEGEDVRQHRRTRRIIAAIVVALLLLAIGAAIGAMLAVQNADRAEAQTRLTVARQLSAPARLDLDGPLDRGLLLGLEAHRSEPGFVATTGIVATAQRSAGLPHVLCAP